ncbi:hypothetical protein HQ571_06045 [Candidatus Kuenenbacteria bacterium]|nr:hypothetical protein [Candidatus Kuenenbacteria bacterium]
MKVSEMMRKLFGMTEEKKANKLAKKEAKKTTELLGKAFGGKKIDMAVLSKGRSAIIKVSLKYRLGTTRRRVRTSCIFHEESGKMILGLVLTPGEFSELDYIYYEEESGMWQSPEGRITVDLLCY